MGNKILSDGSVEGKTFSGPKYKGKYPSPKDGEETYKEYYERVQVCKKKHFNLGDLSWDDWHTYCLGSPGGGGQYVSNYTIGQVPDHAWISYENDSDDED